MTSPLRPEDPVRIGRYELTARIGKGGQGVVYLGNGPDGGRVAVKVMESEWASDTRARSRFAKEINAASKVAAFCTATLLDADVAADPPYIVSEYIDGPSLRQAVLEEGPRTGAALDRLAISTATALVAIHEAGVVHRDFKPANVLLGPDGPRVIDFGIARSLDATVTATNSIVGTPAYMAPEQVEGGEITPAVDVFAWAGVMAFAATGESPFHDETLPAIIHRVLSAPPRLDGVDERLRPLLEACLDKDPRNRPTAVQVLGMLVGHDPTDVAEVPVTRVLREGYTAAVSERTQIAPTAALPIGTAAASAQTETVPAPDGETESPAGPPDDAPTAIHPADTGPPAGPATGPTSGPMRTTSGLAGLVGGVSSGAGSSAQPGPPPAASRPDTPGGTTPASGAPAPPGAHSGYGPLAPPVGPGAPGTPGSGEPVVAVGPRSAAPPRRGVRIGLALVMAAGLLLVFGAGGWLLFSDRLVSTGGPADIPADDAATSELESPEERQPVTEPTPVDRPEEGQQHHDPAPVTEETHQPDPTWTPTWPPTLDEETWTSPEEWDDGGPDEDEPWETGGETSGTEDAEESRSPEEAGRIGTVPQEHG